MPTMTIKVNSEKLIAAFRKAPKEISKEIRLAAKKSLRDIQKEARSKHRFISRTNQLERSVSVSVSGSGLSGSVFLDEGIAPYGKFVHRGQRSWAADEFLFKAFRNQSKNVIKNIELALKRAFKKVGLK